MLAGVFFVRRNLTDGWKFELAQVKRELLLVNGKEKRNSLLKVGDTLPSAPVLSTIDKTGKEETHNTQAAIAKDLGWSTGKTAMAEVVWKKAEPEVKEKIKAGAGIMDRFYQLLIKAIRAIHMVYQLLINL